MTPPSGLAAHEQGVLMPLHPMVKWQRLDGDREPQEWAALVGEATDRTPFQSYAWGEYKRHDGWTPQRWIATDESGAVVCGLQALVKPCSFQRVLVWVPGGPLAGLPGFSAERLGSFVEGWLTAFTRRHRPVYVRFFSCLRSSQTASEAMRRLCRRPAAPINTGSTIHHDLSQPLDRVRAAMTSKHRYYVKRSEAAGLKWSWGSSTEFIHRLARLHEEMVQAKRLRGVGFSHAQLEALSGAFGQDCFVVVGSREGRPVTACLTLLTGPSAFYLVAATGAEGRTLSAAYAMVARLLELLQSRGIRHFDFGGIAQGTNEAAGVDHFKRGFGGQVVEHLGEWEWAPSSIVRWGVNVLIRRFR